MGKQRGFPKVMWHCNTKHANENGLTLVELLAVLVLSSIIAITVMTIFIKSSEYYKAMQIENELRDEADILMSKTIKTLYALKAEQVHKRINTTNESYLAIRNNPAKCTNLNDKSCLEPTKKLGFITTNKATTLYLLDEVATVSSANISLQPSRITLVENSTDSFEITLTLRNKKTYGHKVLEKDMTFINVVQTIPSAK